MKNFQHQPRSGFGFGSPHTRRRPARSSNPPAAVTRHGHPPRSQLTRHPRSRPAPLPTVKDCLSVGVGMRQHASHLADARWGDRLGCTGQGGCPDARGGATDQDSKKAEAPQWAARPEGEGRGRSRTSSTRNRGRPHTARGDCGLVRDPVEKAMPYDTALPLLQARASATRSEGASPHRSTQSGQCTVQADRARDSVPVFAGTRHPQPAQSAGYLLERGLFRVCMVCSGSGL